MKEPPRYQPHLIYLEEVIRHIAHKLGCPKDTERVLNLVESVLYAVGKRLPFVKAVTFFAALPLPLQALMVEQWEIDQFLPDPMHSFADLLDEIVRSDQLLYPADDSRIELAKNTLLATLEVIAYHVTPEAMKQIIQVFPEDIQERVQAALLYDLGTTFTTT